ncbi:hypothetical protein F5884DRAFT_807819, partial [Xylogone sp. PMI_703]
MSGRAKTLLTSSWNPLLSLQALIRYSLSSLIPRHATESKQISLYAGMYCPSIEIPPRNGVMGSRLRWQKNFARLETSSAVF